MFIPGNINQFLKVLSSSQDKVEAQLNKVLANSSHQPKISAADDELNEFSNYWQYFDDGIELLWGLGRLRSIAIYTQQSDKEGYLPYTDQLFSTFSNMAHKNTVEEYLGSPSKTIIPGFVTMMSTPLTLLCALNSTQPNGLLVLV